MQSVTDGRTDDSIVPIADYILLQFTLTKSEQGVKCPMPTEMGGETSVGESVQRRCQEGICPGEMS